MADAFEGNRNSEARQRLNKGLITRVVRWVQDALKERQRKGLPMPSGAINQYDVFSDAYAGLCDADLTEAVFPLTYLRNAAKSAIDNALEKFDVRRGRGKKRRDKSKTRRHVIAKGWVADPPGRVTGESEQEAACNMAELEEALIAEGPPWVERYLEIKVEHDQEEASGAGPDGRLKGPPKVITNEYIAERMGWSKSTAQRNMAELRELAEKLLGRG